MLEIEETGAGFRIGKINPSDVTTSGVYLGNTSGEAGAPAGPSTPPRATRRTARAR